MTFTGYGAGDHDWGAPLSVKTVLETTKGDIELKSQPEGAAQAKS